MSRWLLCLVEAWGLLLRRRSCARWWLAEKSDKHIHETTGRPPLELFLAQEQSRLLALPAQEYDCAEVALRVCSLDGFVEFETNRYSVPYEYVGDILTLKASEEEIFIYNPSIDQIASHQRRPASHGVICEDSEHRKYKHICYGLEPVREAFERLGDNASEFLAGLRQKHPRFQYAAEGKDGETHFPHIPFVKICISYLARCQYRPKPLMHTAFSRIPQLPGGSALIQLVGPF